LKKNVLSSLNPKGMLQVSSEEKVAQPACNLAFGSETNVLSSLNPKGMLQVSSE
jgi:hypothetical protein